MRKDKRRPSAPKAGPPAFASVADSAGDPLAALVPALVVALLVARWLVPTESAAEGDTLWIVQLWLAGVVLWAWGAVRRRNFSLRVGWFDAAFWTVIAGHLVSAAVLFAKGGDRRAAINVGWEWVGLGGTLFLLRQVVPAPLAPRKLLGTIAVLGMVLAGFGVWQAYVFYPHARMEYESMQRDLGRLKQEPAANADRIRELEFKMQAQGIPTDEAGRIQYENRLRFSNEPFGPFALANTFAGLLLVTLMLTIELFRTRAAARSPASNLIWIVGILLQLYCLVLTKGRTAWVGLGVALLVWGVWMLNRRALLNRRAIGVIAIGALASAALVVMAAIGGGLDKKVLSEAPKSLAYRLEYWKGAWRLLEHRPFFGTGPGNFRHLYLQYKLPQSSEEIADPHNMLLDLWASGGVLALLGLVVCLGCAVFYFGRRGRSIHPAPLPSSNSTRDDRNWTGLAASVGAGFGLACLSPIISATGVADFIPVALYFAWLAAFAVLRPDRPSAPASRGVLAAAAAGLFCHLLGAGGIEMPAIVQCFLLLVAVCVPVDSEQGVGKSHPRLVWAAGGAAAALFVICLVTATLPVLNRKALIAAGDEELGLRGDVNRAAIDYGQAAIRDPFSAEPGERLANALFSRWEREPGESSSRYFQQALGALNLAIERDPANPALYRRLGDAWLLRFARSKQPADAEEAEAAFRKAVDRYPNDSALRAKLASAQADAGHREEARGEAERALQLDSINHAHEHVDRYLPAGSVEELRRLAGR